MADPAGVAVATGMGVVFFVILLIGIPILLRHDHKGRFYLKAGFVWLFATDKGFQKLVIVAVTLPIGALIASIAWVILNFFEIMDGIGGWVSGLFSGDGGSGGETVVATATEAASSGLHWGVWGLIIFGGLVLAVLLLAVIGHFMGGPSNTEEPAVPFQRPRSDDPDLDRFYSLTYNQP